MKKSLIVCLSLLSTGCAMNSVLSDKSFYKVQTNEKIHKAIGIDMSRIKADYIYKPDVDSHILLSIPVPTEANITVGKYLNDNLPDYFNGLFDKAMSASRDSDITVRPEIMAIRSTSVANNVESEVTLKFTFVQKNQIPWALEAAGRSKEPLIQSYGPGGSRNGFNTSMEKAINESLDKLAQDVSENRMRF